jgi:hypothetical protein
MLPTTNLLTGPLLTININTFNTTFNCLQRLPGISLEKSDRRRLTKEDIEVILTVEKILL